MRRGGTDHDCGLFDDGCFQGKKTGLLAILDSSNSAVVAKMKLAGRKRERNGRKGNVERKTKIRGPWVGNPRDFYLAAAGRYLRRAVISTCRHTPPQPSMVAAEPAQGCCGGAHCAGCCSSMAVACL